MQKHRGLFHLRVYESAEGVVWFASFQRKRTYYLPWNFYFLMQIVKNTTILFIFEAYAQSGCKVVLVEQHV